MTEIDLQKFCSKDETRYGIMRPFTEGKWTYATNGHIIVRVPAVEGVGPCEYEKMVAEKVMPNIDGIEFTPLAEITLPPVTGSDCLRCQGRGTLHACPDCECECKHCDGNGTTSSDHNVTQDVRGAMFSRRYVRMLLDLPGIAVPVTPPPNDPMPFKFDSGEGALMPLRS